MSQPVELEISSNTSAKNSKRYRTWPGVCLTAIDFILIAVYFMSLTMEMHVGGEDTYQSN